MYGHSILFRMRSQTGRASASQGNGVPRRGRTDRHQAAVQGEVGLGKPWVTYFKPVLFANLNSGCPAFPPTCPHFWLEKHTSHAKCAFLTGVPLTGFQKHADLARVTAGLRETRCPRRTLWTRCQDCLQQSLPSSRWLPAALG